MPPLPDRPYDLVLFGATGYTGQYCAEHLTTSLPTDLTWAVAGRSASKLQKIIDEIRPLNPDRKQPSIEECPLEESALNELAGKCRVLVNCVGPYALYGEAVLKACVENGTGYIDTTGEMPWILKMVKKYHERAKSTGAIIIPQCGFESCASDMLTYTAITSLHSHYQTSASHVTATVHSVQGSVSGGTLSTVFAAFEVFTASELLEAQRPWILSPIQRTSSQLPPPAPRSLVSKLTTTHHDSVLGHLTTWPLGSVNSAVVQRTWGLLDQGRYYGPRFTYAEYMTVRNRLFGIAVNIALAGIVILLAIPPVRWIAKRLVTQAGQGPDKENAKKGGFELRAVAETDDGSGRKVLSRMIWKGGIYHVTAVYMMEAAATLLRDRTEAHEIGGGLLTPACLGEKYAERLRESGLVLDAKQI